MLGASRIPVRSLTATFMAYSPLYSHGGPESLFAGDPHLNTTLYCRERIKPVRKYMVIWATIITLT